MKDFSPAFLGEINRKHEGNVGSHGSSYLSTIIYIPGDSSRRDLFYPRSLEVT